MRSEVFTVTEISGMLKVSKATIRKLIADGILQAYRVGRQYRVEQADFDEFMDAQKERKGEG